MRKTLNVLSIDFDFFQNVDIETIIRHYPDPIDLPTELSRIVWTGHYASPIAYEKIKQVTPDTENIEALKQLIKTSSQKKAPDARIANSHKYAYDFIMDHIKENPDYEAVNLVNIDMHHDLFNDNQTLDCGNWIGKLMEHLKSINKHYILSWIANKTSFEAYSLKQNELPHTYDNFDILKNKTWDLIFLCRSDNWLPPHLDDSFTDLVNDVIDYSSSCEFNLDILQSRYDESFKEICEQMQQLNNAYAKHNAIAFTERNQTYEQAI